MTQKDLIHEVVADYLSGDDTLDRSLILSSFANNTDDQLADNLIEAWTLDRVTDDSGQSWMQQHDVSREELVDQIAWIRANVDDEFPPKD